jgi:hypothetical protein
MVSIEFLERVGSVDITARTLGSRAPQDRRTSGRSIQRPR